ncbi:MAG: M13 family metallopeptidase [Acidobacteriota bacterium]|nr:M13 family metallopeptidase [Acidobacteriota bacterium]
MNSTQRPSSLPCFNPSVSFSWVSLAALLLVGLLVACSPPSSPEEGSADEASGTSLDRAEIASRVADAMDREADPCQDFYRYACGSWVDNTELPADQARWSRLGSVLQERNKELLKELLEAEGDAAGPGTKARRFYGACMDEEAVETAGLAPLQPWLERFDQVQNPQQLLELTGELHRLQVPVLFEAGVIPDFEDPTVNALYYSQGGLGLPERGYYLREDEASRTLLDQYRQHVARMLDLLAGREGQTPAEGESEADDEIEPSAEALAAAEQVVALEIRLAEVSRPAAEMRNIEALYNPKTIAELQAMASQVPWQTYWDATGYQPPPNVIVAVPEFFETLSTVVADTEPEVLRSYLRWHLIHDQADFLPSAVVDENFRFFGRTLSGQQELPVRWKRCVEATDQALGEDLGQLYVEHYFPGDSKQIAEGMIQGIEEAFVESLPQLAWMDETTRQRAQEKAAAIQEKIGYPDEWRDYSALTVSADGFLANAQAARVFEYDRVLSKAGGPVDRGEWFMSPPTVNAYYNALLNEIVFPAGILQPDAFHRDFPMAMNFGGIGAVMGHELTHGFDDSGRKFDAQGRLREWWQPEVSERFDERAQCVQDLYSSYEVEPGLNLDGKLTLGENIADLGGVKEAHRAYRAWREAQTEEPEPLIEGLTDEQLFFVAYGQVWCAVASPEYLRLQARTDPHSTPRYRVVGPVSNLPAFGEAFDCPVGSPMRPEKVCEVW